MLHREKSEFDDNYSHHQTVLERRHLNSKKSKISDDNPFNMPPIRRNNPSLSVIERSGGINTSMRGGYDPQHQYSVTNRHMPYDSEEHNQSTRGYNIGDNNHDRKENQYQTERIGRNRNE